MQYAIAMAVPVLLYLVYAAGEKRGTAKMQRTLVGVLESASTTMNAFKEILSQANVLATSAMKENEKLRRDNMELSLAMESRVKSLMDDEEEDDNTDDDDSDPESEEPVAAFAGPRIRSNRENNSVEALSASSNMVLDLRARMEAAASILSSMKAVSPNASELSSVIDMLYPKKEG